MAGGGGTRFWPLSRQAMPKQMLNLSGKDRMINETIDRLDGVIEKRDMFIVTNEKQAGKMLECVDGRIAKDHILAEPSARNTAAYSKLTPELSCVWNTGEEDEIMKYMSLIDSVLEMEESVFSLYEQKLLLLALTYRICSVYNRKLISAGQETGGRKNEIFVRLIQLIEQYYMQERSVEFYADKLCLSPKYLSALSKSICGYTVQELVFKAIIRKCISLLKNTQKNIQEISNEFGFPNASYFGTFFKKQMGMSPQQYRRNL